MAGNLKALGKYGEAQPLYEKALAISKNALGEDHPSTAICYNNLATNLNAYGRYAEAQPLFERALAIRRQALGEEHHLTGKAYMNVAANLGTEGKYGEAQPLYEKALAIYTKTLGDSHPSTALGLTALAVCLDAQGKHRLAQPLCEKAMTLCQKVLGEEHISTALCYNNLAFNLHAQGKYIAAEPFFRRALKISQTALGEAHPHTALGYSNLGFNLDAQGKYKHALPLYENALVICKTVLGEHHPYSADSYNNVALALWRQHNREKAIICWQSARKSRSIVRVNRTDSGFDRSHAEKLTVTPDLALAAVMAIQGRPAEAARYADTNLARGLLDSLGTVPPAQNQNRLTAFDRQRELDALLVPLLGRFNLNEAQQHRRDALLKERAMLLASQSRKAAEASETLVFPLPHIQKQVPNDVAMVLWVDAFAIGEHWGCVIRAKGPPQWQRLPGSGSSNTWVREDSLLPSRLLTLLSNPLSTPAERQRLIRAVRKQRLEPLRRHLEGVRKLLVVPTWPMEALPAEVLCEDYLVSYIPSPSFFARRMTDPRGSRGTSLLALGDPVFSIRPAPDPPPHGMMVKAVLPRSHAAEAGLHAGDILLSIGNHRLESTEDLKIALSRTPTALTYWREGKQCTIRLAGTPLGAELDKRSPRAAFRAWRRLNDSLLLRGTGYQALPGTRREVQALARLVPDSTVLLGSAASEQNLAQLAASSKLKSFRLLHFATHGEVNQIDPRQSALILAQDRLPPRPAEVVLRGQKPIDGRLTVQTILEKWDLNADLVVLSACQTGLGKNAGGEGLLGFAQAFLQKNARTVVVSRWKVDDTATTLLMVRFYENLLGKRKDLKKPLGRAAALDEARRWLRTLDRKQAVALAGRLERGTLRGSEVEVPPLAEKEPKLPAGDRPYAHPYYWAPFILIGDPD